MIDVKWLRGDVDGIARQLQRKKFRLDVARYHALEDRRKHCDIETQRLQGDAANPCAGPAST